MRGNPGGLLNEGGRGGRHVFWTAIQLIVSHHGRASAERKYMTVRGQPGHHRAAGNSCEWEFRVGY